MASGIRNPNLTVDYEMEDGSVWTFRREQTGDDRDAITSLTSREIMGRVDRKHVRELMRKNGDLESYLEGLTTKDVSMSAEKASLAFMGVKVSGPFFTVPEDYTINDAGDPHPMAGKLIPQPPSRRLFYGTDADKKQHEAQLKAHIEWLGLLDPEARSEALSFCTRVWAGASPEDLKTFQGGDKRLDKPGGNGKR